MPDAVPTWRHGAELRDAAARAEAKLRARAAGGGGAAAAQRGLSKGGGEEEVKVKEEYVVGKSAGKSVDDPAASAGCAAAALMPPPSAPSAALYVAEAPLGADALRRAGELGLREVADPDKADWVLATHAHAAPLGVPAERVGSEWWLAACAESGGVRPPDDGLLRPLPCGGAACVRRGWWGPHAQHKG
eukprot:gene23777-29544_t